MDEAEYALICSLTAYPSLASSEHSHAPSAVSAAQADASPQMQQQLSVSEETFALIKRQAEHRRFRSALRLHRQEKTLKRYIARHGDLAASAATGANSDDVIAAASGGTKKKPRESLLQIAVSVDFSPCMLARVLLEAKYGWSKTTISNFFKEALADGGTESEGSRTMDKETIWRGLGELEFTRLLQEVRECIDRDVYCSPFADRIRHNMGVEYEYLLVETLRNRRLVFESEDVLREKGLSKTPDVRLLLPFGVRDSHGELRVVNWIDSKAMFGDRHTHETENAGQLQGYVNRYGPGMVIYWFGHVANLSSDRDVLITHEFPKRIELPGGLDPLESAVEVQEKQVLPLEKQRVVTTFDGEWTAISFGSEGETRMAIKKTLATTALLLTLVLCALLHGAAAQKKDYEIVNTIVEDDSDVVVVRRNQVMFLLYDETIIGAEFDDPDLRLQAAYPGFAIMQSAAYMDRKFEKAAQIGLGIGTVPSFLRHMQIPTDVIEISDAVVRQAANYFHYERCEAEDPEECVNGETFVADGLAFLQQTPEKPVYDLFIIDVYTGWNPVVFYVQEVMQNVRDKWLRGPSGVFVVNFVGFFNGPHAVVPKSILRTLQSVFKHVKVFREMDNLHDEDASNIVFFASNEPFKFNVPTHGDYKDPIYNTYFYIVANFPTWEIFTDMDASVEVGIQQDVGAEEVTFETTKDASSSSSAAASTSAKARVLTQEEHGQNEFQDTHAFTQEHMRGRVVDQFPQSFWDDVKKKRRAKSSKTSSRSTETKEEL